MVTSFTNSQTLCTICICNVVSFSIETRSSCHKGLNVPVFEVLLVCFASFASSFEQVSSILVLWTVKIHVYYKRHALYSKQI